MENVDQYSSQAMEMIMEYGPKLILAILTLLVGLWVIKAITNGLKKRFEKSNLDVSLRPFLLSLTNVLLKVLLVISVMSMIGIAMTSTYASQAALASARGA